MIEPHGGRLVELIADDEKRKDLEKRAPDLPVLTMNRRESSDLTLLANGGFSPLEGFMTRTEYESVLESMRLPQGLPWTIPVTLSLKDGEAARMRPPFQAALVDTDGTTRGMIEVEEIYEVDKEREASKVLLTTDDSHPGVQYLKSIPNVYAGGKVTVFERRRDSRFPDHHLDPAETRALFEEKGWRRIVAFQTRNPIHRAHEYLLKCALEIADGLFIHPIVGETKPDDIPEDVRMDCYRTLIENYFPEGRVTLAVNPAAMRYAGPREAIFHAIVRKNYGCTHFIVGRDHAGVGSFYGTYDAQTIFDEFEPGELGITPLMFEHAFYCKKCLGMSSAKTCPHGSADRLHLSGTKVREMLLRGEHLPEEFTRKEIAEKLERYYLGLSEKRGG